MPRKTKKPIIIDTEEKSLKHFGKLLLLLPVQPLPKKSALTEYFKRFKRRKQ